MSERTVVADPARPWLGGNIKGGDEMTYFPELWQWLIDFYEPKSILDIGCGEGHLMKFFSDRFVKVEGIDGMQENKDNAHPSIKDQITVHDYTTGHCWERAGKVDMVISCEFVEHVEEQYMENFLLDFCDGDVIVLTHALPGQPGYHHVNCKENDDWATIFKTLGYKANYVTTAIAYTMALQYKKVLWETVIILERYAI
jgi:trans-aconitate methyltransferase